MAMATYCTDSELLKYRSNILSLGVSSWQVQREEAFEIINRVVIARWYRKAAPEMGIDPNLTAFDPELVKANTLTRLEAFKTLELAYMILKKDGPEKDGFERNEEAFRNRFNEELEMILGSGIDYDWSNSGVIDLEETGIRITRRNIRA